MNLSYARCFLVAFVLGPALMAADLTRYPRPELGNTNAYGRNIQRTMRLLAMSTPEHRNTVRILFYGQSIIEQKWSKMVADDLRARFPNANLVIENRALGGFASQMLVKTADTDLYPFYPDLLIFQVYGAHNTYEDIIRRTRERTTAEILQQNDHLTKPADLTEETDPAKLPPAGTHWDAFMNQNWLPTIAKRYGTELCDQRSIWKRYVTANHLAPKELLRDGVHLNAHGEFLMAECVKAYLRYDPSLGSSPAEGWIKTMEPGKDAESRNGRLRVEFDGNRVDAIVRSGTAEAARIRIDGKKPSAIPSLYGFTRALATPGGKWPVIAPIGSQSLLEVEDWTMKVTQSGMGTNVFEFTLAGSKTGPDGGGRSDRRFVSDSGRIVIETNAWNVSYAMALPGIKPVPREFTVKWSVIPWHVDELITPATVATNIETIVTLAQGLPNAHHVIEIEGGHEIPVEKLRIYSPPLKAEK